jgi:hypothetical protein
LHISPIAAGIDEEGMSDLLRLAGIGLHGRPGVASGTRVRARPGGWVKPSR